MILVDVNLFIDVFEGRGGFAASLEVLELIKKNKVKGCISALTVPLLWFLTEKRMTEPEARSETKAAVKNFSIVPLNKAILQMAFKSEISDFEDAVQFYSAEKNNCEALVTRNKRDFVIRDKIAILTPEEFLNRYGKG